MLFSTFKQPMNPTITVTFWMFQQCELYQRYENVSQFSGVTRDWPANSDFKNELLRKYYTHQRMKHTSWRVQDSSVRVHHVSYVPLGHWQRLQHPRHCVTQLVGERPIEICNWYLLKYSIQSNQWFTTLLRIFIHPLPFVFWFLLKYLPIIFVKYLLFCNSRQ